MLRTTRLKRVDLQFFYAEKTFPLIKKDPV